MLSPTVRVRVGVRVRRGYDKVFNLGIKLGDGVCEFDTVTPDRLCPSVVLGLELGKLPCLMTPEYG